MEIKNQAKMLFKESTFTPKYVYVENFSKLEILVDVRSYQRCYKFTLFDGRIDYYSLNDYALLSIERFDG